MLQVKAPSGMRLRERATTDRTVTLSIKKQYLEQIASGHKRTEERDLNEYYSKLFIQPFDKVKLHYQTKRQLLVQVKRLRVIEDPQGIPFYCLELGDILSSVAE